MRGSVHTVELGKHNESDISDRLKNWTTLNPLLRSTEAVDAVPKHLDIPDARVGPSMVVKGDAVYLWGGRGGVDMAPLDHPQAGVWRGQAGKDYVIWDYLTAEGRPETRSYHTAVVVDVSPSFNTARLHPDERTAIVQDKMYVHAGCPATGRLSTLHSFDLATHQWQALSSAPEPPRGGTSIVGATLPPFGPALIRYGGELNAFQSRMCV